MADIWTIRGWMDESILDRKEIITDNENEHTVRYEWFDRDGIEVRSDVHVTLKKPLQLSPEQGSM